MSPRKQPPQQDPEEEDDTMVTSKQFKEMMHMMESIFMTSASCLIFFYLGPLILFSPFSYFKTLERMQCGITAMADQVHALQTRLPITATDPNATTANTHADGDPFAEYPRVDNDEHFKLPDPPLRQRRPFNQQGMRGNQNHHNQHYVHNDDPFAKVKFSIPPFNCSYDAEAYLDWKMTVEQKFSSHLVPEQHRVRQVTSEFKDFAVTWWNELATLGLQPHTWDGLKQQCVKDLFPLLINVIYVRNSNT
jgi:hypothetical protein